MTEKELKQILNASITGCQPSEGWKRQVLSQTKEGKQPIKYKLSASLVLAILLALLTLTTALALGIQYGILDFAARTRDMKNEIPSDVDQYIDRISWTVENEHATVVFRESLYNGRTLHIAYDVIPKSKDMLLFDGVTDESWWGLTHLEWDQAAALADGRTIIDRWEEGGYGSCWEVDFDVDDPTHQEFIQEYGSNGGVLDEETGVYTGTIEVPFTDYRPERTIGVYVRILPLTDIHDEYSYDYDRTEVFSLKQTFHAMQSGSEKTLKNTSPLHFSTAGIEVQEVELQVLPQEIQYRIGYKVVDEKQYHASQDRSFDDGTAHTEPPLIRFVSVNPNTGDAEILPYGITFDFSGMEEEGTGLYIMTGSLGRSEIHEKYTLALLRNTYDQPLIPLETAVFSVAEE
ncbi:MAG: hypothetical protein IJ189_00185 [Clostridia bacterium]|nr:hypothetical protein [Clostridia bacterium]